jgi:tRNA-specific 2-thiouridylase
MKKVLVGMSGGVDSAVAACLLKQAGYEVVGVTLRTWAGAEGQESRCCEIDDARETARRIGIPYYAFNCVSDFEKKVVQPFVRDYLHGMTPNPCVVCNREIKWERLLYHADVLKADYVATGHYASVVQLGNGRYTVRKAAHSGKDQTYMLSGLSQDQLKATLMPLGNYTKEEVRAIAKQAALPVAEKAVSL